MADHEQKEQELVAPDADERRRWRVRHFVGCTVVSLACIHYHVLHHDLLSTLLKFLLDLLLLYLCGLAWDYADDSLQKGYNRNLTSKDLQLLASSVLLAALSVAPYDDCRKYGSSHLELENEKGRGLRLASLVDFFSLNSKRESREKVSRASLLSELAARGVISCASQEVQDLYNLMEHEFLPLDLASKVQPLLSKICTMGGKLSSAPSVQEIQLSPYQHALEKVTTLRVLQQASCVFQFMRIDVLSRMIPFFDLNVVEKIAVDAARRNFVAMKVNHLSGAVHFGNMDVESDVPGSHLGVLADSLDKASSVIHPPAHKPSSKLGEDLISLAGVVAKEHERLVARKSIIEKRKEDHECQILEQEKAKEATRLSIQKKSADEERERLMKEQRIRHQTEEKEQMEAERARLNKIKQAAMDFVVSGQQSCPRLRWEMMEKKMQKREKVMDYLERARRQEEAPLIEEAFRKRVEGERVLHEQGELREIKLSEQRHAGDLQEKNRLYRLSVHKDAFQARIVRRREAELCSMKKEREERFNQLVSSRKHEQERLLKLVCYLGMEEQRIRKVREEDERCCSSCCL